MFLESGSIGLPAGAARGRSGKIRRGHGVTTQIPPLKAAASVSRVAQPAAKGNFMLNSVIDAIGNTPLIRLKRA